MAALPIFPLHTVLFPGAPLQLHIFEDRYQEMISRCLQNREDFGVVLIREGQEALGPVAAPHSTGTSAKIVRAEPLGGGRMNLTAIGGERFRIRELLNERVYLEAEVEWQSLDGVQSAGDARLRLVPLLEEYLNLITREGPPPEIDQSNLPEDAARMAYACAYLLQAPQFHKQSILELNDASELLRSVEELLRKQIAMLRVVREQGGGETGGAQGYSPN